MMKQKLRLLFLFTLLNTSAIIAQVENLTVEKYYISDGKDATDTDGGSLPEGSVTYRIYLDLAEGNKLKSIYGSRNHPLKFASTEIFFNNVYRDKTFGYQVNKNNLDNNTVALDSWITMGFASNLNYGVPKDMDTDGSIIGGVNNDGGSALIPGGLLTNDNPGAGIPLTVADGLVAAPVAATGFFDVSFLSENGDDSTIFGSLSQRKEFTSYEARLLHNPGISGNGQENRILLAQLTTLGNLSFALNIEIEKADGSIINYVANDLVAGADTFYSKWLKYPLSCGCTDPGYLEFDKAATCDDGSCSTPVIFGCLDPTACNYDPGANRHLPELCCHNSACALELGIVCPETIYGCTDPDSYTYNPLATTQSGIDTCCYTAGCMDDRYWEYDPDACYDDGTYCKILKIEGCMDPLACNYNPFANIPNPSECIFGCPETRILAFNPDDDMWRKNKEKVTLEIIPNPVNDYMSLYVDVQDATFISYAIWDMYGRLVYQKSPGLISGDYTDRIDISGIPDGIYNIILHAGDTITVKRIIKN